MEIKIMILMSLSTLSSGAIHELNVSVAANRTNRDIKVFQESSREFLPDYQPPTFNYHKARQMAIQYQDHQKQRYVQQQRMDMKHSSFMRKPLHPIVHQIAGGMDLKQHRAEQIEDWQPFQPTTVPKSLIVQRKAKNLPVANRKIIKQKQNDNKAKYSGDSNMASSEDTETKTFIDRKDIPESERIAGNLVYLPQSLLQQVLENSKTVENLGDVDGHQISKVDYSALSELVGKNPNVQLEGLQRLLRGTPGSTPAFSVIQEPQPFKAKDHTPITEKTADVPNPNTRPNINVEHDQTPRVSSIIPTVPVDQNALESIQKQLDEASKLEADEAFARAQEQARAHVEAQHKAIVNAQKAIFENVQKSFDIPQASSLVQIKPELTLNFRPTPIPEDESPVTIKPEFIVKIPQELSEPKNLEHVEDSLGTSQFFGPTVSTIQKQFKTVRPTNISLDHGDDGIQLHHYPSKNVQYYAPNHIHQATVQLRAEKALESHSKVTLNSRRSPTVHRTVTPQKKVEHIQELPSKELEAAQTYQQFHLETDPESGSAKQLDGSDNIQYAANYAFGYRIKDIKGGNDFGHREKRHGKNAQGKYYVLLPDGRKQHVEYYADDSGYHAKVSYDAAHHQ